MVEVTKVDECIMREDDYTLGLTLPLALFARIGMCEAAEKNEFYDKLSALLNCCSHRRDTLIFLSRFSCHYCD